MDKLSLDNLLQLACMRIKAKFPIQAYDREDTLWQAYVLREAYFSYSEELAKHRAAMYEVESYVKQLKEAYEAAKTRLKGG